MCYTEKPKKGQSWAKRNHLTRSSRSLKKSGFFFTLDTFKPVKRHFPGVSRTPKKHPKNTKKHPILAPLQNIKKQKTHFFALFCALFCIYVLWIKKKNHIKINTKTWFCKIWPLFTKTHFSKTPKKREKHLKTVFFPVFPSFLDNLMCTKNII